MRHEILTAALITILFFFYGIYVWFDISAATALMHLASDSVGNYAVPLSVERIFKNEVGVRGRSPSRQNDVL